MSPKPVDVRRALATLRQESPAPEQTERLLVALREPLPLGRGRGAHRPFARPLALAMTATALALALVFPPRARTGAAWAQTLAQTLNAPIMHVRTLRADGTLDSERWVEGSRVARLTYRPSGRVSMEYRTDGARRFLYLWGSQPGSFSPKPSPNARRFATVGGTLRISDPDPFASIDALLKEGQAKVLGHESATARSPERYRLSMRYGLGSESIVTIEPGSRRIATLEMPAQGLTTRFDYPSSIPASVFEPRAQVEQGLETYDDAQLAPLARRMVDRGLGTKGGVTLRLAVLDAYGALWVYWTGPAPDGGLTRPFHIVGVRTSPPFGVKAFTTEWRKEAQARIAPRAFGSTRVGGMGVSPKTVLGKTVDLDVPTGKGSVRFRNVPILRVGTLGQVEGALVQRR